MDCILLAAATATVRALCPLLTPNLETAWRERIESQVRDWWRVLEAKAMQPAKPVNPQRVYWELSPRLPERAIITCDSGSSAAWYAMDLKMRPGMLASLSGGLATMGCALPYALAGKLAHPDRAVIALAGDGAMQMNGINCLITIAERWRDWANPQMVIVVLNNRDLNFVTWEQRGKGEPKYRPTQDLPAFPYADYARLLGLDGVRVDDPAHIAAALDQAFQSGKPCVVEIISDPDVPPMPAHVTREQAASYYEAISKGEPDAQAIRTAIERQKQ
jgi:pyruvate dehydrogenase (quinone)